MASARGSLHYELSQTFNGFLTMNLNFDISVEVSDNLDMLTAWITNNNSTWSHGARTSWGFLNFSGMLWDGPMFNVEGVIQGRPENLGAVMDEMNRLSGGQITGNVAWGVYCSDNTPPTYSGTVVGRTVYTRALSPSDFTDGRLNNIPLVRYGARWYSSGEQGHPYGVPVVSASDSSFLGTIDIPMEYFPCAVNDGGGGWLSCDRNGGRFQVLKGVWVDRRNIENSQSRSTTFIRNDAGSGWDVAPKIGRT